MNLNLLLLETANTGGPYAAAIVGPLIVMFALIFFSTRKNRSSSLPESMKTVSKKYSRYLSSNARVLNNIPFNTQSGVVDVDRIIIDEHGVMLIRIICNVMEIYGQAKSETWKGKNDKGERIFANPILELESILATVRKVFSDNGIYNIPIVTHAVFYDRRGDPQLFLGNAPDAYVADNIKKVMAKRNETPFVDINIESISDALKAHREAIMNYEEKI